MSREVVPLQDLVLRYLIPAEIQELFEVNNGNVRAVDKSVFERVKRQATNNNNKRVHPAIPEFMMIQPLYKKPRVEADMSIDSQATLSSLEHCRMRSAGLNTLTSAGSILNSEAADVSKGGSHGSILQSELCNQQDSLLLNSEVSLPYIIDSEPDGLVRSSSPPVVEDLIRSS